MVGMDVESTTTSTGLDQTLKIQTTTSEDVDRPNATTYHQSNTWGKHNAYYKKHSSVKSVINKLGDWTVGKGVNFTNENQRKIWEKIIGSGKDTGEEVIKNQVRVRHIDGDSYAEICGGKGSALKNLKPLNSGAMKVYYNDVGMLDHYGYQFGDEGKEQRFEKEEIFHLSLNRNADETHGTGDIASIITFLDKIKQLDEDMAVMFHRFVVPLVIWSLNTDDPDAVSTFKTQEKSAWNTGDNMIIPDDAVSFELMEAGKGVGKLINPMEWRQTWVEEVTKGGNVPALIMAIEAGTSEASSKMVYLAWQQVIEDEQNYIEKQIKQQLGLEVTFEFPARIEENLGEDEGKDGAINTSKKSEVAITSTDKPTPKVKKE